MNLFTVDLRLLTFEGTEEFLRIRDPEGERPQEGMLLDFNENVPPDLGDIVTAFSNTYGGLVILGVKEKKGSQLAIPDELVGIPALKHAIQGKIVNIIWSTVQPHPLFSIGLAAVREVPDRVVAVVRVEQGIDTPYMYVEGERNKISVRIGDSNRRATLEQVRALFEKSLQGSRQLEESLGSLGDLYVLSGETRSPAFHQLMWVPVRPIKVRLDHRTDSWFLDEIRRHFPRDRASRIETMPAAAFTDFDGRNPEWNYHRKWRFSDHGGISFVSKIGRIAYPGLAREEIDRVGDWILDALSFIRLVRAVAAEFAYFGNGVLVHSMSCFTGREEVAISATMPTADPDMQDEMQGVRLPERVTVIPMPSSKKHRVVLNQLDMRDIVELLAESFLYHIRYLKGQVDWDKLCHEIKHLMDVFEAA